MTMRNGSSVLTKLVILLDGATAGWDFRHALVNLSNGDVVWAAVFFVLGALLLAVALFLLALTDI